MGHSIKLTQEIQTALKDIINEFGSQSEFSRQCLVDQKNISRYTSGQVNTISDGIWSKLYPFIKKYLSDDALKPKVIHHKDLKYRFQNELINKFLKSDRFDADTKVEIIKIINEFEIK